MPKAPRFQFHLATAFVLMFAAGVILAANLLPRAGSRMGLSKEKEDSLAEFGQSESEFLEQRTFGVWFGRHENFYGWPCHALNHFTAVTLYNGGSVSRVTGPFFEWDRNAILVNALVAFAILATAAVLTESLTRNRTSKINA